MIFKLFFLFFSSFLSAQSFEFSLEKNISGIKNKLKYEKVNEINFDAKNLNKDYRIALNIKNDSQTNFTAMVIRYSFKLNMSKNDRNFQTVSLFASSIRVSEIKKGISKQIYIYDIKNIFPEMKRFLDAGYKPVEIIIETMKEPRKNEDLIAYSAQFPIK
ncbi:MAG: hypothetical protein N2Z60_08825 [Elusimicrobiales bacterium]|nr:hypothetical protein [Elusimicrobiales bacterium]HOJ86581.1 hypothetical protein [Elusimicrobiales bacterium]HOL63434.1 hypothetical protein [Elusimicrobiales bacterium]